MDNLQTIETLISAGRLEEALAGLDAMIEADPEADLLYFTRGKLHWRLGHRAAATSDYSRAVTLNPSSPAATALAQARAIEDFYNHDLYNP